MKVQELLDKVNERLKKVESLATKTATNTEKYYWEVKEMKASVAELIKTFSEVTELLLALVKQQIGD